jgi:surface protein
MHRLCQRNSINLRALLLLTALLFTHLIPSTNAQTFDLSYGLVAYYPFDGNANDVSGNGRNAIGNATAPYPDRAGMMNGALRFDGLSSYVLIPENGLPSGTEPRTFSFWIKNLSTSPQAILNHGGLFPNENITGNEHFELALNLNIGYGAASGSCSQYDEGLSFFTNSHAATYTANMMDEKWHHVVYVMGNDGDNSYQNIRVYLDGDLISQGNSTWCGHNWGGWSFNTAPGPMIIGRPNGNIRTQSFNGLIDDFGIWNRALMVEEISDLYKSQSERPFITSWNTQNAGSSESNQIYFPGAGSYTLDWQFVSDPTISGSLSATGNTLITFPEPGIYRVFARGELQRFAWVDGLMDKQKLLTVDQWGDIEWTSMEAMFQGASLLRIYATDAPDLRVVKSTFAMFNGATSFNDPIGSWDVSNVTDMSFMFWHAKNFNQNLESWDVSMVKNMHRMFEMAESFNQPIGSWNVSNVENMDGLFYGASVFNNTLRRWCVSKISEEPSNFSNSSSLQSVNYPTWGTCPTELNYHVWGNLGSSSEITSRTIVQPVSVAAGFGHALVLNSDGTVSGIGELYNANISGLTEPDGVVAISAGHYHNIALHTDGTVSQWIIGTWYEQGEVPAGLDSVIAIAAGDNHSLALRANGQVVAWGNNDHGQSTVPQDLCPVVAISADAFSAALCRDGTARVWGWTGETVSPASLGKIHELSAGAWFVTLLTDQGVAMWYADGTIEYPHPGEQVVALASEWHALALREDGHAFGWNFNNYGQADVPSHVRNVTSIAAGRTHSIAVTAPYPLGYSPRMNAHATYRRPEFRWTRPDQSASYRMQISRSRDFSQNAIVHDSGELDAESYTLPITLAANTQYYWRVSSDLNDTLWSWPQRFVTGMFSESGDEFLESWSVKATIGMVDQPSAVASLGATHLATDGYDEGVDLALTPPPPGQTLRAWFSRPDWNAPLGPDFSSDIRAVRDLTSQVQSWILNVRAEQAGELTLRLAPDGAPSGLPLSVSLDGVNASGMDSVVFRFDAQAAQTYSVLIEVGDLTAPMVLLDPDLSGPAIWQADQPRRIGWSIDEANRLSRLHLQYRVEPGDWQSLHDGAALEHYDWTPVAADDATRRVWFRLEAVDAAGNAGSDSTSYPVTVASPRQGIGFQTGWSMVSNPLAEAQWSEQGPALRYVWQAGEYRQPQVLAEAQGYWLGGYRAGADTLVGTVRASGNVLTLPAGWNLTGSGLLTPVRADSVSVTHGGHGRSLPLPAAIDSSWVTAPLGFDGQSYGAEDVFVPKKGYWLGVSVPEGVSLGLPVHRQDSPAAKEPAPQTATSLWITLRDGTSAHKVGVSTAHAVPAPPTAPNASRIGLLGPASALGSVYLQAKAESDTESAWPLVIGGEARTVELSWSDQDFAGLTAVLELPNRRYDLTRANSISLRSDESAQVIVGPISTSTESSDQGPLRTELHAAYPNPFNPSTQISYSLDAGRQTRIAVYDLLGREVAVLVNGTMPAGRHRVTFDASGMASGVYLVRLEAGGEVFTRRVTLLK